MKGKSKLSYKPFYPFDRKDEAEKPYICRLAPYSNYIEVQWFDNGGENNNHTLFYAERGTEDFRKILLTSDTLRIEDLKKDTEYEIYILRDDGERSNLRLARTGDIEGTVVNYLHPEDTQYDFVGQYLCSPSIVKLESGALIASMDVFHGYGPRNLSLIFRSDDEGKTWRYQTDLYPCFWGTLFTHGNRLYIISVSNKYGDVLIAFSEDEGKNWSTPSVLMRGSCIGDKKGFHKAPTPVIRHSGRLFISMDFGAWECKEMDTTLLSALEDDDLMDPESWTFASPLKHDKTWENASDTMGGFEGNAVVSPDGKIATLLRYDVNKALMLKSDPDKPHLRPEFYKVISFPMGHTKFEVRRNSDGIYYAVGNVMPARKKLDIYKSKDLENWTFHKNVADFSHLDWEKVGYQYPAFLFEDKETMLILSRTALNEANSYHNNNYITFHRVFI